MRLKSITLQNFRRYRNPTTIDIDMLTALIGRGDAGKSTILEALDIFFEGNSVKMEPADANTSGDAGNVRISAEFDQLPDKLDLDRGAETTLEAERLVNSVGNLEIIKVYNCSIQKISTPKIYAKALYPSSTEISNLLLKSNNELKELVKKRELEDKCKLSNNPSMRQVLFDSISDLKLAETEVPLTEAEAKKIWEAIKRHFPVFALFRSDRESNDQDPEVQSPMKLAIQSALANLTNKLDEITDEVQYEAEQTAKRTLEQLRQSYPEQKLASVLKPVFRKPNWTNVFKIDLESDDRIPLNKRGSGIRRLILLSFFQAEAERKRVKQQDSNKNRLPVIYAIEEPETSQHPDSQEQIIRAFQDIAEAGDQVILTTHVPGLASLLPLNSLRFVDTDPGIGEVRVRRGKSKVFDDIARTLGVLPTATNKLGVRVAVAVEGPTDIDALMSFIKVLTASGDLSKFDDDKVFWAIGGGDTLKHWVDRRYLDRLNIPQVYLFDSDRNNTNETPHSEKVNKVKEINERPNCEAFLTEKRTIENYLHPNVFTRLADGNISFPIDINLDFCNVPDVFIVAYKKAKEEFGNDLNFHPKNHNGQSLNMTRRNCKQIITAYVMCQMTSEEIKERGMYINEIGQEGNEIIEWLSAIEKHLNQ